MICLTDLSALMQRTIAKGITFMVSQSGIPRNYNLYFAKYIDGIGNRSMHLSFDEDAGAVIQCADENHSMVEMMGINAVLEYVENELKRP